MQHITLSQAIEGFTKEQQCKRLSQHTIDDYHQAYKKLQAFVGNPDLDSITVIQIKDFFNYLSTTKFRAAGIATRPEKLLSNKTLLNIHTALSALWTWATDPEQSLASTHVIHRIPRPEPKKTAIHPFSEADLSAMLKACEVSSSYHHHRCKDDKQTSYKRPTLRRDRAIILLLVDTGLRASELCDLRSQDVDRKNDTIKVEHGKGDKERIVPFSSKTAKALWQYLTLDRDGIADNEQVFRTAHNEPMTRNGLLKIITAIGKRAGVRNAHPHRFRHTFATLFLMNGGDAFTLQQRLGHSSLDMVSEYLDYIRSNGQNIHRDASPVANLKLS